MKYFDVFNWYSMKKFWLLVQLTGSGGSGVNNFCLQFGYNTSGEISLLYDKCFAMQTVRNGFCTQKSRKALNILLSTNITLCMKYIRIWLCFRRDYFPTKE